VKNREYSIRKVSAGIASIIISLNVWKIGTVNAATNSNISTSSKVIIDKNGVIPDVKPNLSGNVIEEPIGEQPVKSEDKSSYKSIEKTETKSAEKPSDRLSDRPAEKTTEKPTEQSLDKSIEKPIKESAINSLETDSKEEIKNDILVGNLSGREIKVSFKRGSISVEKLYVEPINDNHLNETIKHKLGSDYNIIETFEIHFEKDYKKVDINIERTVAVAVVKKDNSELEVYHIADGNNLEKVNSRYNVGELKFNINHFSKFTIVERIKIGAKDLEERAQIVILEKNENKEKEDDELPKTNSIKQIKILPKTGIAVNSFIFIGFFLLIEAIIIRKKKNYYN
jgi:S-layer protein